MTDFNNSPVQNEVVLEKVFSFFSSSEELLAFRCVSRIWNSLILSKLFKKERKRILLRIPKWEEEYLSKLSPYFTYIHLSFRHYEPKPVFFQHLLDSHIKYLWLETDLNFLSYDAFMKIIRNLQSLIEIKIILYPGRSRDGGENRFDHEEESIDNISTRNLGLTSLKFLNLTTLHDYSNPELSEEGYVPIQFTTLFEICPNIKELSFVGLTSKDLTSLLVVLQSCDHIKLETLEILDENMCPTILDQRQLSLLDGYMIAYRTSGNIRKLGIELSPVITPVVQIPVNFTLPDELNIRRFPFPNLPKVLLPIRDVDFINSLAILELSEDLVESLPPFPCLTTLKFTLRDRSHLVPYPFLPQQFGPLPSLKSLVIEHPLEGPRCIRRITRVCGSSLISLKIRANDETAWELWTCLRKLEDIRLTSWDGLTDAGFTGNPGSISSNGIEIMENLRRLWIEMWPPGNNHVSDEIIPSLLSLGKLRQFCGIRTEITEESLHKLGRTANCQLMD